MFSMMNRKIILMAAVILLWVSGVLASDTMLMFVGEDLEVLSIASKKEEAAWSAPAIAQVITREEFEKKGAFTIAQSLDDVTGFYVEKNEKGSAPYLRGVPDSVLFLYDIIPVGSGVQKSSYMIDREISLASVKRIEVIRGTGSVLWGPNAFAGVVNVVPMTGMDFQGLETGGLYSSLDQEKGAYLNYGIKKQAWSSFLSVSGLSAKEDDNNFNVKRFWNDGIIPEPIDTRYGSGVVDDSTYVELYSSISLDDWLTLSARISDSKNAFAVSDWEKNYNWEETISSSIYNFKIEASKNIDMDSGIRFTGYFSGTDLDHGIVDREFSQKEESVFGELIYDKSLFAANGLATLGTSWRKDRYNAITVFKSFYPDFFIPENLYFLPEVEQSDFENELLSIFGQYRHKVERLELWAGARYDDHDQYEAKTSYSAGFAWNFSDYIFKSIYGTAYRTPFAKQLDEYGGSSLEEIKSVNFQLAWKSNNKKAALTLFRNKIDNHVIEDRYAGAGLSTPNSQTIDGAELEFDLNLTDNLKISGNITMLDSKGPDETYFYNDYSFIDEDGEIIKHYQELNYEYDPGAPIMFNFSAAWNITKNIILVPELKYFSERTIYYPTQDITKNYDDVWVFDLNLLVRDLFPFDLGIHLNNLFNSRHDTPGLYSINRYDSFSGAVVLKMSW